MLKVYKFIIHYNKLPQIAGPTLGGNSDGFATWWQSIMSAATKDSVFRTNDSQSHQLTANEVSISHS